MSSDGGVLLALLCVSVLMTGSSFAWSCFKSLALLWRCNALLGIALRCLHCFALLCLHCFSLLCLLVVVRQDSVILRGLLDEQRRRCKALLGFVLHCLNCFALLCSLVVLRVIAYLALSRSSTKSKVLACPSSASSSRQSTYRGPAESHNLALLLLVSSKARLCDSAGPLG